MPDEKNESELITDTEIPSLSDEDFMKHSPEDFANDPDTTGDTVSALDAESEEESSHQESEEEEEEENTSDDSGSEGEEEEDLDKEASEEEEDPEEKEEDPSSEQKADKQEKEQASEEEEGEEEESSTDPDPDAEVNEAEEFFKKITAPFKADGKELTVRTPEDAIRLMQMGANYSRRMQEIKPLRAMDSMLKANGLDPDVLNYLIDIKNGNPEAIQKLLKEHKIDPIDIDTDKETSYVPADYSSDPQDQEFTDAIEQTINSEGGQELINNINSDWDDLSKNALRESPVLFADLLMHQQTGIYTKIKEELDYQKTLGHLGQIPFLQAYRLVGDALEQAGALGTIKPANQTNGLAPLRASSTPVNKAKPIGSGPRKAVLTKREQPNPDVSSIVSPKSTPSRQKEVVETDFATMSDEDFSKLGLPT